jgi:hypothetical protein
VEKSWPKCWPGQNEGEPLARTPVNESGEGIETNYVSLIEPFDGKTGASIQIAPRLSLKLGDHEAADSSVAMRVNLTDGRSDFVISNDSGAALVQPDEKIATDAKLAMIRRDSAGSPRMLSFCNGTKLDTDMPLQRNDNCSSLQDHPQHRAKA